MKTTTRRRMAAGWTRRATPRTSGAFRRPDPTLLPDPVTDSTCPSSLSGAARHARQAGARPARGHRWGRVTTCGRRACGFCRLAATRACHTSQPGSGRGPTCPAGMRRSAPRRRRAPHSSAAASVPLPDDVPRWTSRWQRMGRDEGPDRPWGIGRSGLLQVAASAVRRHLCWSATPTPVRCPRSASDVLRSASINGARRSARRTTRIAVGTHARPRTSKKTNASNSSFAGHQQASGRDFAGRGPFAVGRRQTDSRHVDVRAVAAAFRASISQRSDAVRRRQG